MVIDYLDSIFENFYSYNLANKVGRLKWEQEGELLEFEKGQPFLIVLKWEEVKKVDYAGCWKNLALQSIDMLFQQLVSPQCI